MNYQELVRQVGNYIGTQPLLSATLFGVIFSVVYLILMMMTRLGDIRRGLQSFILSAVIHLLVILALGEVVPRTIRSVTPTEQVVEIPIREVIVEERTEDSNAEKGKSPLLETLPESARQDFERRDAPQQPGTTMPEPQRKSVVVESRNLPIPEIDKTAPPESTPTSGRTEIQVGNQPSARSLEISEETAKAAMTKPQISQQREQEITRQQTEMKNGRESTAESKPIPLVRDTGTPEVQEQMDVTRPPAADEGLAESAVTQKGELAPEDPGPTAAPEEKSSPAATFVRKAPERRRVPSESAVMERSSLNSRSNEKTEGKVASQSRTGGDRPPTLKLDSSPAVEGDLSSAVPAQIPSTYRLRDVNTRQERAISLGATPESEQAVERALVWLARHQDPAGFWDADGFSAHCPTGDRCDGEGGDQRQTTPEAGARSNAFDPDALRNAGKFADTGITGLVILCYLGAGYTHENGKYADQVDRALRWLVSQQQENGFIGGDALRYDKMYCHGMATLALGEACGMTRDPKNARHLRKALVKAVQYIIDVQNPNDGGWRYLPGQRGDMSMFGWQLMALRSAELAGIPIPEETRNRMRGFLSRASAGSQGGLSAYMPGEAPKRSMTAESLFSRLILSTGGNTQSTAEGVAYLMEELPRQSRPDLYYWYYGTLALYHHGGEPWDRWNQALQETLVGSQRKSGHASGSWDPRDPWSTYGGRLYSTTFSVLSLEVYYRFLPLYQVSGKGEPKPRR